MKYLLIAAALLSSTALARGGSTAQNESNYVALHCQGDIEHQLPDRTRIDCLTDTHAIEYDFGKKWAESIGQALFYSAMTGKKAGVVLIVNERSKRRYLKRIKATIEANKLNIDVWTINASTASAPVKFL